MSVLSAPKEIRDPADPLVQQSPNSSQAAYKTSFVDRTSRKLVLRRLDMIHRGSLLLVDRDRSYEFGDASSGEAPALRINNSRFWRRAALGGLGAADAFIAGDWDCDDLVGAMRVVRSKHECAGYDGAWSW